VSRRALLEIYRAGIEAADGRRAVAAALRDEPLSPPVRVIALGKAAPAMALGALDVLGDGIVDGLCDQSKRRISTVCAPARYFS
jgi:hydroxypyruvate reductase